MNTSVRTRILSVLALTAAMATAPLAVSAASPSAEAGARYQHSHAHKRVGSDVGKALRNLDLTQEQKDQIFKIRHDQKASEYEQKKAVRTAAKDLRESSKAEPFDAAKAKSAADALGQAQAQLALQRAETRAKISAVLTPEQRQKMADAHQARMDGKAAQRSKGHKAGHHAGKS